MATAETVNEWKTIDVGELMQTLRELLENGAIDLGTKLYADKDPEGNGFHPLRAAIAYGGPTRPGDTYDWEDHDEAEDGWPVSAICFGVGYDEVGE